MKKYILLLFSVFAFGQASNQMVTFTQAQSLGFALKSGQSHVTSNQCMTKSDALAKYNVDADAMSSYANNQLVPRSVWVKLNSYESTLTNSSQGYEAYGGTPVVRDVSLFGATAKIKETYWQTSILTITFEGIPGSGAPFPTNWTSITIGSYTFLRTNLTNSSFGNPIWYLTWNGVSNPFGTTIGEVITITIN